MRRDVRSPVHSDLVYKTQASALTVEIVFDRGPSHLLTPFLMCIAISIPDGPTVPFLRGTQRCCNRVEAALACNC